MSKKATLIIGPQGSGKSTRARKIAGSFGSFVEIDGDTFIGGFGLASCAGSPKAVVIEEVHEGNSERVFTRLKALITSDTVRVERKHKEAVNIPAPNFIVVAGGIPEFMIDADRRYTVIDCSR